MEITEFKINFMNALTSDVSMLRHSLSSSLAHKISEEMAKEYQYVINRFYTEYTPHYYKRHASRGMVPGLMKTFKKYYKNPHSSIYYGGIEINSDDMYKDYRDSREQVLESFLEGYHGRPSEGIESSILPYKHMLAFRQHLINELGRSDSALLLYAKNKAKAMPYKLIKIT